MSAEKEHGIEEEPENTCPFLDESIRHLELARKTLNTMRPWGEQWRDVALDYKEQIEEASKEINRLEELLLLADSREAE
jgi:hypothetical protein